MAKEIGALAYTECSSRNPDGTPQHRVFIRMNTNTFVATQRVINYIADKAVMSLKQRTEAKKGDEEAFQDLEEYEDPTGI